MKIVRAGRFIACFTRVDGETSQNEIFINSMNDGKGMSSGSGMILERM